MHASATLATLVSARLLRIGRAVVDGILPPRCLACGETVGEPDALCGRCWASITFFAPAWCAACGAPFAHPMGRIRCAGRAPASGAAGIGYARYCVTTGTAVIWCLV